MLHHTIPNYSFKNFVHTCEVYFVGPFPLAEHDMILYLCWC